MLSCRSGELADFKPNALAVSTSLKVPSYVEGEIAFHLKAWPRCGRRSPN
jgi:hypothetical protein